jgi:hypothetical protein
MKILRPLNFLAARARGRRQDRDRHLQDGAGTTRTTEVKRSEKQAGVEHLLIGSRGEATGPNVTRPPMAATGR